MYNYVREDNRKKGVLLPVFSLPSPGGIGCFSAEAKTFIDWLADTGHQYWQILPLNPLGRGGSPYQPLSSFAGEPYYIDLVQLAQAGLLTEDEADGSGIEKGDVTGFVGSPEEMTELYEICAMAEARGTDETTGPVDSRRVNYIELSRWRMKALRLAFDRWRAKAGESGQKPAGEGLASSEKGAGRSAILDRTAFDAFVRRNEFWLEDYALFMALRGKFDSGARWSKWPEEYRDRKPEAMKAARSQHRETIEFYRWVQFAFATQWDELKGHANEAGVKIIGDMPIYVSYDSADCWADPEMFQLDGDRARVRVSGCPPDVFTPMGQMWGNPLYDWDAMKKDGYRWWLGRARQSFSLYDCIRLDHFRGFEAYFSIPADAENGLVGEWIPGPGMDLFRRLEEMMEDTGLAGQQAADGESELRFIAEDLGFITDGVRQLLADTGYPGTRVLQFGFDGDPTNPHLPENYEENCVACTGNHDTDTTIGWFEDLSRESQSGVLQYLGDTREEAEARLDKDAARFALRGLLARVLGSRARLTLIPLQDYLEMGSDARVNVPGTIGGNWSWRMTPEDMPRS